ncbi:protein-disulfide reductase DsbD family protein [Dyella silvatica]|uniref:protein-disulfide reductase DsbD family protein n=1 Tax=Dyella silvatica TaxID=2992128 RepID=UPI00225AA83B|nr:protein-disulfide reductase DsbD [Dyella silvatica]
MRSTLPGRMAARFTALLGLLLFAWLLCSGSALAQDTEDGLLPVTEAYKLSADAGTPGVVKLHWVIAPDYYLYRGRMKFKPGEGITLGDAQLPDGKKHHDEFLGDVETYHDAVDASVPYSVAPGTQRLKLSVQYQGCHEVEPKICYPPHTEQLDLPLPGADTAATDAAAGSLGAALNQLGAGKPGGASQGMDAAPLPAEQAFHFEALARSPKQLLLRWSMPKGYYLYRDQTRVQLKDAAGLQLGKPAWPAGGVAHQDANFGNVIVYFDQVELPVTIEGDAAAQKSLQLVASFQGCQDGGLCYPLMTRAVSIDLGSGAAATGVSAETAPQAPPAEVLAKAAATAPATTEFTLALVLGALLGGLLLNLMPCVLPVLSLKVIGVLENASELRALRRHAVFYTAGVLLSFALLAVIAHLFGKGLGAQLQNPTMVAVLVCVMLAVGLWLSGVVEFGGSLGNVGQSLAARKGPSGDFFTGVLAVLVATPCTGPFMGPPMAYALSAPLLQSLLIFMTLGLGLALPILAIAAVPALARLLPRPGRWMETLKQVLAFPMYLTAAWLVWVLAKQRGADAVGLVLVSAVLLAMTLWWLERSRSRGALSRAWVAVLALATLVPLYYVASLPPPSAVAVAEDGVVAYSPEKLAELRKAGTPVLVDMTADWCVTCKANEHAVLDTDAFRALLKRTGAVYMKGDWTDVNPTIASFLQQYHSPGVPLYVVFPKNGGEGRKLSTVLTSSLVEQALTEAAQ